MITIRDYDEILREKRSEDERSISVGREPAKTKITLPRMFDNGKTRRVVYQIWDWNVLNNEKLFRVTHYTTLENLGATQLTTKNSSVYYRLLTRKELTDFLTKAGFKDVRWREPKGETLFYQPVVSAFI